MIRLPNRPDLLREVDGLPAFAARRRAATPLPPRGHRRHGRRRPAAKRCAVARSGGRRAQRHSHPPQGRGKWPGRRRRALRRARRARRAHHGRVERYRPGQTSRTSAVVRWYSRRIPVFGILRLWRRRLPIRGRFRSRSPRWTVVPSRLQERGRNRARWIERATGGRLTSGEWRCSCRRRASCRRQEGLSTIR